MPYTPISPISDPLKGILKVSPEVKDNVGASLSLHGAIYIIGSPSSTLGSKLNFTLIFLS